jgi:peptidyl-prolyl cis-trans isomerase C
MKKIFSLLIMTVAVLFSAIVCVDAAEYRQVQAMHILVPTEAKALEIRQDIVSGQTQNEIFNNFRNAAKRYSTSPSGRDGGLLGYFGRGDMVKPFEEAAFNLPNGQVSEPVKTQFGYHLIYVISKK